MVVGQGRIGGRRAAVQGDDFTVRGGAADAAIWQKMVWAERLAHDFRIPLVRLVDGTGGGGSVKSLETMGFTYVPFVPGWDLTVENLSPRAGRRCRARPRRRARRGARGGQPLQRDRQGQARRCSSPARPVVAAAMGESPDKEALGGARTQTQAGGVDNEAADEDDALDQLKRFLSYLPDNAWETPPISAATDPADRREEELLSIVPRDPPQALQGAPDPRRRVRLGLGVRDRARATAARSSPRSPASGPAGGSARLRPALLRRRDDGGGVGQAGPVRRHLRPVPHADRQLRRPAGVPDRHASRSARGRSGAARARCTPRTRRPCRG